jgi:hypothetical protein
MTTNSSNKANADRKVSTFNVSGRWMKYITQAVAAGITSVVSSTITAFMIILVLLGGLWLAYTYLPQNVFLIILAVLFADIMLGIVLRSLFLRR